MLSLVLRILCILTLVNLQSAQQPRFSSEEVAKIKQIIHEMTAILEDNHAEVLELEEVLSVASTGLRKSRTAEHLRRKLNSMKGRLKDLRTVRSQFATVDYLKEFVIGVDDRLKIIEDNLAMIEKIYFPVTVSSEATAQSMDDYPTFINPGDPRYELDEDQEKLAHSIQKTRNLMSLRASRESSDKGFSDFVDEVDSNLKDPHKPLRRLAPVLGRNTLDQFHNQLEEARRRDPSFDWNDKRSDDAFTDFFQKVERMNHQMAVGRKDVISGSNLDVPDGPRSRKTFNELVNQLSTESSKWTSHKIVLESLGKPSQITGINAYLNETRMDSHQVARKDFSAFYQEMQPVHSEVILSYQKGIITKGSKPENVLLKEETLAWVEEDEEYLRKLRNSRVFEQVNQYHEGEKLLAERTMRKTKQRVFSKGQFSDGLSESEIYVERATELKDHNYHVSANTDFFTDSNSPMAHQVGPVEKSSLVQHRLSDEKTLVPVTVQLLDEQQVPHRNVPLHFELILPTDAPKVKGLILEGEEGDPLKFSRSTDHNGEATIHLLMTLYNRQIQVEREIVQRDQGVVCKVVVKLI